MRSTSLKIEAEIIYTVLVAAFGLIRYIYVVKEGNDPTMPFLKDRQIMITGIIWVDMIGLIIYK